MKRNVLVVSGFSAIVALAVIGHGCSSSDGGGTTGTGGKATTGQGGMTATGQGGMTATGQGGMTATGQGGMTATGQGGMTAGGQGGMTAGGQGGMTAGGQGGMTGAVLACAVAPTDKVTPCNSDPSCTKTCGINASAAGLPRAAKLCTCPGPAAVWSCPSTAGACVYPTADWSCLKLPATPVACPGSGTTVTAATIISGTTPCTQTTGTCGGVCGSPTGFSYQDNSGGGKMGYCACMGAAGASKYQCASVAEWAPQM